MSDFDFENIRRIVESVVTTNSEYSYKYRNAAIEELKIIEQLQARVQELETELEKYKYHIKYLTKEISRICSF